MKFNMDEEDIKLFNAAFFGSGDSRGDSYRFDSFPT